MSDGVSELIRPDGPDYYGGRDLEWAQGKETFGEWVTRKAATLDAREKERRIELVHLRALATLVWDRYEVQAEEVPSYDGCESVLYVFCLDCREAELKRRKFLHVGTLMLPELGCLGPGSGKVGVAEMLDLALPHEHTVHGGRPPFSMYP